MKRAVHVSLIGVFLVAQFGISDQSRTTEFHTLGEKIASDKVMNFILPDGYFLSGIVKNASGAPLNNVGVGAINPEDGFGDGSATDVTGMFSFPLQAAVYSVFALPPSNTSINPAAFSRSLPYEIDNISVANDTDMGEIKLQNGYILSGEVKSPFGTPLNQIKAFGGTLMAFPSTGVPVPSASFSAVFGISYDTRKYAMVIPPGKYKLILSPLIVFNWANQQMPIAFKTDNVTISNKDTVKNIVAPKGYKIWGTVKDSGKKRLTGTLFVFQKTNPFVKYTNISLFRVLNGTYTGYLPAGSFTLVFLPFELLMPWNKGKATKTSFDLVMPASDKMLNLVAQNGVVLSGKLTDVRNNPVKGGVLLAKTGADASNNPGDWVDIRTATTAGGQYRVPVPPDTYDIFVAPCPPETTAVTRTEMLRQNVIKTMSTLRRLYLQYLYKKHFVF